MKYIKGFKIFEELVQNLPNRVTISEFLEKISERPAGRPPMGHPPMGHPPMGHPPMGHPPMGHPPMGHPPMGHPPMGHPPMDLFQRRPPMGPPNRINKNAVIEWWNKNRSNIEIYYFPFKTDEIMGCSLFNNQIAINSNAWAPPEVKLFILIHESKHADQQSTEGFKDKYFDMIESNDIDGFEEEYIKIETEANDFAVDSMLDMGFDTFISHQEAQLRGNELVGKQIFKMVKKDFEKTGATSIIDLLKQQIL